MGRAWAWDAWILVLLRGGEGRLYWEGASSKWSRLVPGTHGLWPLARPGQSTGQKWEGEGRGWAGHGPGLCTDLAVTSPSRSDACAVTRSILIVSPNQGVERELARRRTGSGGHMTWPTQTGQPPALIMTMLPLKYTLKYSDTRQRWSFKTI